ncbi:MAG: phosphoketolase family protein [Rhodocyclaceae bacterium]
MSRQIAAPTTPTCMCAATRRKAASTHRWLAMENEIDRYSLAIDVINRVPSLLVSGAHMKEKLRDMQIVCRNHAHEHGVDLPEADAWVWPY